MVDAFESPFRPSRRAVLGAALASVAALATGCSKHGPKSATAAAGSPVPSAAPADGTVVMIIRHGEKPVGGEPGLDESGKSDGKSLTARGWERAKALPGLFAPPKDGLVKPAAVFAATDQGPHAGAHRMRQTVTPLAQQLGLKLDTDYAEGSEQQLAAAVLALGGPVLICWEHSRIPAIVAGLGASGVPGVPAAWPDRFDLVWVFRRQAGAWTFTQVQQHLLSGDQ